MTPAGCPSGAWDRPPARGASGQRGPGCPPAPRSLPAVGTAIYSPAQGALAVQGCYKKQVSEKVWEQMLPRGLHAEAWGTLRLTQLRPHAPQAGAPPAGRARGFAGESSICPWPRAPAPSDPAGDVLCPAEPAGLGAPHSAPQGER